MAEILIRQLTDQDDLEALTEGNHLAWWTGLWKAMEIESGVKLHWFAAELDGEPAGMVALVPLAVAAGGTASALLNVVPSARRRGVGSALREAAEASVRGELPGVVYSYDVRSTDTEGALTAWGLDVVARHSESVLDLTALKAEIQDWSSVDGVEMRPLPALEEMSAEDWESIHAFAQDRFREAPDSRDGGGELPIDLFRAVIKAPWMLYEAVERGERIGVTFVCDRPTGPDVVNTYFTGVTEAARGPGVAIALKATQALRMAAEGKQALYTQNMAGNDAILAANRKLGFVPDSEYADVLVDLTT